MISRLAFGLKFMHGRFRGVRVLKRNVGTYSNPFTTKMVAWEASRACDAALSGLGEIGETHTD